MRREVLLLRAGLKETHGLNHGVNPRDPCQFLGKGIHTNGPRLRSTQRYHTNESDNRGV